jgi:hypothetical protein
MHNNFFWEKSLPSKKKEKKRDFISGHYIFFHFSLVWQCVMNHKHEAPWPLKKCTLFILCTSILFNPFHPTIGSSLTLIQNEF